MNNKTIVVTDNLLSFNYIGIKNVLSDSTRMLGSRPRGSSHGRLCSNETQGTANDGTCAVMKVVMNLKRSAEPNFAPGQVQPY